MIKKYQRKSWNKIIGSKLAYAFPDMNIFGGAWFVIWCLQTLILF